MKKAFEIEYKYKKVEIHIIDFVGDVRNINGTPDLFSLSYNSNIKDKGQYILATEAEINIYEDAYFNIDELKTVGETDILIKYFEHEELVWQGFALPDFFQTGIAKPRVLRIVATDRLGVLKNIVNTSVSNTPKEIIEECLLQTGLSLPVEIRNNNTYLETTTINRERIEGISAYDVIRSFMVQFNSKIVQYKNKWWVVNKKLLEDGFFNQEIIDIDLVYLDGQREIKPTASEVSLYLEYGGSQRYPKNWNFQNYTGDNDLNNVVFDGWTAHNGFEQRYTNQEVDSYETVGNNHYTAVFGRESKTAFWSRNKYLINILGWKDNNIYEEGYLKSSYSNLKYTGEDREITLKVNFTIIKSNLFKLVFVPIIKVSKDGAANFFSINSDGTLTVVGTSELNLDLKKAKPIIVDSGDGDFYEPVESLFEANFIINDNDIGHAEDASASIMLLFFGYMNPYITESNYKSDAFLHSAEIIINKNETNGKGLIFKTKQGGDKFSKVRETETTLFSDKINQGVNGYFYNYKYDDTSITNLPKEYLLTMTRQMADMFCSARDFYSLGGKFKVNPLARYKCGNKYFVFVGGVSHRENSEIDIEEIVSNSSLTRTDYIYTYFEDSKENVKSIGTASGSGGGGGAGGGGGMTSSQLEMLTNLADWWRLDEENDAIYSEKNVYSLKGVSALGLGSEGGGGGGDFDRLDKWVDYDSTKAGWVLSALLGKDLDTRTNTNLASIIDLNTRVNDLQSGSATNIEISGSGNAVTGVSKSGNTLTFAKSSIFALSTHNHSIADITGLQDALDEKEPAFTKNSAFNKNFGTTAGTVAQGNDSRIINGQTAYGWGDHAGLYPTLSAFNNHANNNVANQKHLSDTQLAYLNNLISWWKLDEDGNLYTEKNLYSTKGVSALGLGDSGSGGGGGVDMLDAWANYTTAKADYYVPASLLVPFRNDTLNRLTSLESGSATSITTTGTGNAITSLTKSGSVITATKGSTFSLSTHNHNTLYKPIGYVPSWGEITGKPTTFAPSAHTHTIAQVTGLQGALDLKASQSDIDTAIDELEIGGRNLIPNSAKKMFNLYDLTGTRNWVVDANSPTGESVEYEITDGTGFLYHSLGSYEHLKDGEEYVISFYIKADKDLLAGTPMINDSTILSQNISTGITTEYQQKVVHFRKNNTGNNNFHLNGIGLENMPFKVNIHSLQVEKGTKATDWSPAPEDQVSDWSTTDVTSFSYIKNKPTLLSQFTDNIGVGSHIENKANPHAVTTAQIGAVDLTTNQSIGGVKTFTGNVGIGTTSPEASLHIKGSKIQSGVGNFQLVLEDNSSNYSGLLFKGTSGYHAAIRVNGGDGFNFLTGDSTSLSAVMRILKNGNVGIGTTNPLYKLDVSGTGRFTDVKIGTHLTDGLIEWDATNNAFKFNGSLYATGGISALGLGEGGGSGGDGVDMLDSWANYTPAKANYYVPASLLVPFRTVTLERLILLESGSATSIVTTGGGNAITSISKSDNVITATKGLSFALASHTHTIAKITGLQGALDLKATQSDITTAINSIEIGGRNLLPSNIWENGHLLVSSGVDSDVYRDQRLRTFEFIVIENSSNYTLSWDANSLNTVIVLEFNSEKQWVRANAGEYDWDKTPNPFTFQTLQDTSFLKVVVDAFGIGNINPSDFQSLRVKLEKGNKATDWTPAPEDVDAKINLVQTNLNSHTSLTNNPHSVTKAQVGLGNVTNESKATMFANPTFTGTVKGVTKAHVGLGNVNNTSDANKPVSTAMQTALNLKANLANPTFTGNVTAPTFIGALSGNASSATKLQTARTIAGVSFDGSDNIDIPFANLVNKPTTLAGYGITDAYTKAEVDSISGTITTAFNAHASNSVTDEKHLTDAQLDYLNYLIGWWKVDASGNLYTEKNLYSTKGVSALGVGDSGGGSGGGVDMLDSWANYTPAKANYYVPASLLVPFRNDTLSRLTGLQGALDGKQPTILTGETSQYYRGDKTWQTLNTSVVSEGANLYFTNARVKAYGDTLYSLLGHTHTIAQITGLQGALDLKATQSDIDTAIDSIEIGGRNLLANSDFSGSLSDSNVTIRGTIYTVSIDSSNKYGGHNSLRIIGSSAGSNGQDVVIGAIDSSPNSGTGKSIQLSFYAKSSVSSTTARFRFSHGVNGTERDASISTSWERYVVNIGQPERAQIDNSVYIFFNKGATVHIAMPKLEFGNKATDWTPAPEDQVSDWDVTDANSFAFLKNKPTQLSQFIDDIGVGSHIANKANPHNVTTAQIGAVDLTTAQTITGVKTFTGDLNVGTNTSARINMGRSTYNYITTPTGGGLSIVTNGDSTSALNSVLIVSPNGNVGVGKGFTTNTSAVTAQLHVRGDILSTGNVTAPTFIGALSGNASSATKLQTARTIWGQSFDGTGNVSGAITGATTGNFSGTVSSNNLIISSTVAEKNISFMRPSYNYLTADTVGGSIHFITNGDELTLANSILGLFNNGSVGIGKGFHPAVNPTAQLEVRGTGRFTSSLITPKVDFGNGFTIEPSGTELVFKHNGVIKQRMLSDGTILATAGITALSTE